MIRELLKDVEPRFINIAMGLAALLLVALMISYSVKPQYQQLAHNRDSLELLQNRMDDQHQLQRMIDQTRSDIVDIHHRISGESGSLQLSEMESYLIGRLQALSWESDIQLIGVRPGSSKRVIQFDEISFEVNVIGRYLDLYDWLNRLNDKLGFVLVTKYRIQPTTRRVDSDMLSMDLTLVFYRVSQ